MSTYLHKPWRVHAIQWTGTNRDEIRAFFAEHPEALPGDCGPYFSRDDYPSDPYNELKFYAWGDDQEVDPGWWVVLHYEASEPHGELMSDDAFTEAYAPAPTPTT